MNDTIEEVAVKNDSVVIGPLVELEGPKDSNDLGEVSLLHHNSILSRISTGSRHRVVVPLQEGLSKRASMESMFWLRRMCTDEVLLLRQLIF